MTTLLIDNIGELTTNNDADGIAGIAGGERGRLHNAAVVIEVPHTEVGDQTHRTPARPGTGTSTGTVLWVGPASQAPAADHRFDAAGRAMLPGWVDSHTHMVFAGDRTAEFEARLAGQSYAAGGINVTVEATRAATDADLESNLARLIAEARRGGTTTLETKTGYGLTVADEVRSAQIAARHVDAVTFLGAHLVPAAADPAAYLALVTGPMLAAAVPFVSAADVFCETGAFDEAASRAVLAAAARAGLATHVHGNQLGHGPGVQLAVEHGSLSVDHVAFLDDNDVEALAASWAGSGTQARTDAAVSTSPRGTVATVLPACDLSTRMPLAPARRLLDAGAVIAIASNCNPGTSYTSSMGFCVATAVLQMGLTVAEAVRAATLGGAQALGMNVDGWRDPRGELQPAVGMIRVGARADLQLLEAPSVTHLAYRPGMPLTAAVWRAGMREF